jgi:S-adenosylmethionine synthetase
MHGNEALFGKNPVYHVGKVIGYFVDEIATKLVREGGSVECVICTRNGWPLRTPSVCVIRSREPLKEGVVKSVLDEVGSRANMIETLVGGRRYVPAVESA